jgi:cytoskeletal protein CcmA (bactofilin family)
MSRPPEALNCPPEWQISAYVDAGLGAADVRTLELHLVSCARCRRSVLALRDEARVLRDLVHERLPAAVTPAAAGRGIAFGLPLAVAAMALASLGASALIEALPRPMRWLAPTENLGVANMLVDLFFAVRKSFAAWFDFAVALAALVAFAGIAYLAADALARRVRLGQRSAAALLVLLAAGMLAPNSARAAFEVRDHETVLVGADEKIDGSLIVWGESVTIEGTITGDLIAFAETVRIRGTVEGNVFCAGHEVELAGTIGGSAHCAGEDVRLAGSVAKNFYGAGSEVALEASAHVGGDAAVAAEDTRLEGEIARDLIAAGEDIVVSGRIGRDAGFHAAAVSFLATAAVPGKIALHMPEGEEPVIATGAALGPTTREVMEGSAPKTPLKRISQASYIVHRLVMVAGAFVAGLALFALAPGLFSIRVPSTGRFFGAVGVGFATMILAPVVLFLLMITVLGIPAALFGALLSGALIYIGPIAVAAVVGRSVLRSEGATLREFAIALLVGLLLIGVLVSLPGIGGFAFFIVILEGIGLLVLHAHGWWSDRRAARAAPEPA